MNTIHGCTVRQAGSRSSRSSCYEHINSAKLMVNPTTASRSSRLVVARMTTWRVHDDGRTVTGCHQPVPTTGFFRAGTIHVHDPRSPFRSFRTVRRDDRGIGQILPLDPLRPPLRVARRVLARTCTAEIRIPTVGVACRANPTDTGRHLPAGE